MNTRVINSKRGTSVKKEKVKVTTTKVVQPDVKEKPKNKG